MQDILNFDKFVAHLTNDEQKQLLKILPSIDTTAAPERFLLNIAHRNEACKTYLIDTTR